MNQTITPTLQTIETLDYLPVESTLRDQRFMAALYRGGGDSPQYPH